MLSITQFAYYNNAGTNIAYPIFMELLVMNNTTIAKIADTSYAKYVHLELHVLYVNQPNFFISNDQQKNDFINQ